GRPPSNRLQSEGDRRRHDHRLHLAWPPCDRPDATFSVGAISLPTETGSIGQGGYSFGTAIASASVQCVARNGNLVSVGGTIDSSSGPIVGQHFVVYFLVTSAGGRSGDIAGQVSRPDV